MMSLELIRQNSQDRATEASKTNKVPYIPFDLAEIDGYPEFPFPMLGHHVPENWTEIDRWFVDSSGIGVDNEMALSISQFKDKLRNILTENIDKTIGFAVVEAGQFQVHVAAFEKK